MRKYLFKLWDTQLGMAREIYGVKTGYFLIYANGRWLWDSSEHYRPMYLDA